MTIALDPVVRIECRKAWRAPVSRIGAVAALALVSLTSIGGYAAALHSPGSDFGRKAAAMISADGWDGYVGLAALSLGVTVLLSAGIVISWTVGREFTDGTVGGLFAIPTRLGTVACAKLTACLCWGAALVLVQSTVSVLGGIALGLPPGGAFGCWLTLLAAGISIVFSALPAAWVATRWRGYLAGIGATLAIVVATNIAAGFGVGEYIPWAIPFLWATPGLGLPTGALSAPVVIGLAGVWATYRSWSHLQLGRR